MIKLQIMTKDKKYRDENANKLIINELTTSRHHVKHYDMPIFASGASK